MGKYKWRCNDPQKGGNTWRSKNANSCPTCGSEDIEIIAGGGITSQKDIANYLASGANHISLGTICFRPWKIKSLINMSS